MTMLAANGFGIYAFSQIAADSPVWQQHDHGWWQNFGWHFEHPEWRSAFDYWKVSFWDLIQPSFMFMVGVSMPFSYARRERLGQGAIARGAHAAIRSIVLVLIGVFLYSSGQDRTNWIFPNVLCQIGLGYFFAWLLLNRRLVVQLAALAVILVGYWAWFWFSPPPEGYDFAAVGVTGEHGEIFEGRFAAWSKNGNAAFRFDQWFLPLLRTVDDEAPVAQRLPNASRSSGDGLFVSLVDSTTDKPVAGNSTPADDMPSETPAPTEPEQAADAVAAEPMPAEPTGPSWFRQWFFSNPKPYRFNGGGYTTLSFIPSIGTTLLGILCGQLLMVPGYSKWSRLGVLCAAALVCFGLGIAADQTICPIVKRIWTPSWVLFSGGYVIAMLAAFYLLFDIAPLRPLAFPLVVVGMNSILIYLLDHELAGWVRDGVIRVHFTGFVESVLGAKALDSQWYEPITLSTATCVVFWLLLYWLYRQRVFLRI